MGTTRTLRSYSAPNVDRLFEGASLDQYAALCYRKTKAGSLEVLLITSRESRRWIIPKGWPMDGKAPHEVAEQEAFEEAGVKGKAQRKPLGYFSYLKTTDNKREGLCIVQVHALKVEEMVDKFREKGQRTAEWVSTSEAASRVCEPELKGLFRLLEQRVNGKASNLIS
ncbi:NUDIX domain-containing protein [Sinorhizobium medicae]|nr:NUDIX domain-containing protein [Sinorhizobium medicae]